MQVIDKFCTERFQSARPTPWKVMESHLPRWLVRIVQGIPGERVSRALK
ncbi:MAG: hypothetical protein WBK76_02355 [Candidatus Saccharimonadales bacterium]